MRTPHADRKSEPSCYPTRGKRVNNTVSCTTTAAALHRITPVRGAEKRKQTTAPTAVRPKIGFALSKRLRAQMKCNKLYLVSK